MATIKYKKKDGTFEQIPMYVSINKTAEMTSIDDLDNNFTSTNVEGELKELSDSKANITHKHDYKQVYTTNGSAPNFNITVPEVTEYKDGLGFIIKLHRNPGVLAITLNVNELGDKPIYRNSTEQLQTHSTYKIGSIITEVYSVDKFVIAGTQEFVDMANIAITATKLQTARKINNVSFDGSTDITITDETKAPIMHSSADATYGIGSRAVYGHVKIINHLGTPPMNIDGYALSATMGTLLNNSKAPNHQSGTTAPTAFVGEGVLFGVYS